MQSKGIFVSQFENLSHIDPQLDFLTLPMYKHRLDSSHPGEPCKTSALSSFMFLKMNSSAFSEDSSSNVLRPLFQSLYWSSYLFFVAA